MLAKGSAVIQEDRIGRLVEVLRTTDGEIVKSAIVQLSLMSEQPSLHIPLIDSGALTLLLQILTSSLVNSRASKENLHVYFIYF